MLLVLYKKKKIKTIVSSLTFTPNVKRRRRRKICPKTKRMSTKVRR